MTTLKQAHDSAAWTAAWAEKLNQPYYTRASARATLASLDALIAAQGPEVVDAPAPEWRTVQTLSKVTDWNSKLIEGFSGASITDTDKGMRVWLPGPQTADGGRVEVQAYFGEEGMRCAYDYSILIPAATKLSDAYPGDPKNICTQHHANEGGGYTGGVSVKPNGEINLRVKGGDEYGLSGSHPYQYETAIPFGEIERDTQHHVRLEILWHRTRGEARARLDDGRWEGVSAVPTWPVGNADGVPTTKIMYRHGLYPQGDKVLGNMEVFYGPLKFEVPA